MTFSASITSSSVPGKGGLAGGCAHAGKTISILVSFLVYWETQQTGDPACEIPRSLVDTVEPSNAPLPGAQAMALGGIGTQGRTGFQNDLWGVSGIDTSDQYSSTEQAVTGTPHFITAAYLISVPLNYGDDFFPGVEVSWSFTWRWVRQLRRYRVQDLRLLKWDPDAADRRWWLVLEAHDLVTGQTAVTAFVLDGAFTVLTPIAMQAGATVTLLAATPHHAVWHETTGTAQRLGVLDVDRETSAITTVLATTPDLKALWQSPDLRGLAPDLLYRTLAEGEEAFVLRCQQCGDEMVVAFSCKGRGLLPLLRRPPDERVSRPARRSRPPQGARAGALPALHSPLSARL